MSAPLDKDAKPDFFFMLSPLKNPSELGFVTSRYLMHKSWKKNKSFSTMPNLQSKPTFIETWNCIVLSSTWSQCLWVIASLNKLPMKKNNYHLPVGARSTAMNFDFPLWMAATRRAKEKLVLNALSIRRASICSSSCCNKALSPATSKRQLGRTEWCLAIHA